MMEFLSAIQPWHWLIVGFLFLGLEALGTGGFLLGTALAGVLLAALLWLFPGLSWSWQLVWFGLSSLVFTVAYWKLFRRVNERSDNQQLNNRAVQLVGRVVEVSEPLTHGQGRVQIGDTLWKVKASETIEAGTQVVVVGADGMTLLVERHSQS
ncbi:NfeD family protein [Endozoicomonas lisbonensis]|uniref:Membrane protein implicated in regulation of membrane protease activity n=1 Tax=Endozoicomonas lisbonensis TaxID=3120522 RepID=A0ABV2SNB0_9GAMM